MELDLSRADIIVKGLQLSFVSVCVYLYMYVINVRWFSTFRGIGTYTMKPIFLSTSQKLKIMQVGG